MWTFRRAGSIGYLAQQRGAGATIGNSASSGAEPCSLPSDCCIRREAMTRTPTRCRDIRQSATISLHLDPRMYEQMCATLRSFSKK